MEPSGIAAIDVESSEKFEKTTGDAKSTDDPEPSKHSLLGIDESLIHKLLKKENNPEKKENNELSKKDRWEKQVLFVESKNLNDLHNLFWHYCLDNFPNIFIVVVKIDFDATESNILTYMGHNLKSHEILLQLQIKDSFKGFRKKEGVEKFEKLVVSGSKEESFKTIDQFFEAINSQKKLLVANDFKIDEINHKMSLTDAIQSTDELLVKLLAVFLKQNNFDKNLYDTALESKNADIILAIMSNYSLKSFTDVNNAELKTKILLRIAETSNIKMLKCFFKKPNVIDTSLNDTWCKMRKIASSKNFTEFTYELHQHEKKVISDSEAGIKKLHENIENDNLDGVKKFVKEFPDLKLCMIGSSCALGKSIKENNAEIYCYLTSRGFIAFDFNALKEIILEKTEKDNNFGDKIEEFTVKYLNECTEKDLNILASKYKFVESACKVDSDSCRKILESVREIEGADIMMKILSQSDVEIIIDMKKDNIERMLSFCRGLVGLANRETRKIYMANKNHKDLCEATFVHEMTHFVCFLIYENFSLPHCFHDIPRLNEFEDILEMVQLRADNESLFEEIFKEYKFVIHHKSELIARVPDFLSSKKDIEIATESIKIKYSKLYDFYQKMLIDFKQLNVYEVIKLNNAFKLINSIIGYAKPSTQKNAKENESENEKENERENAKENASEKDKFSKYDVLSKIDFKPVHERLLLISKTPKLVLCKIVNEIMEFSSNKLDVKTKNIFIGTKKPDLSYHGHVVEKLAKESCAERIILNAEVEFETFFDAFMDLEKEISSNQVKSNKKFEIVIVVDESHLSIIEKLKKMGFKSENVEIMWTDLKVESQTLLEKREIKFQNVIKTVDELLKNLSASVTPDVLKILCGTSDISINHTFLEKNELNGFIDRSIETKIPNHKDSDKNFDFSESDSKEFLSSTRDKQHFQNIVLISDPAGGGKTILLKKFCDNLLNSNPDNFILFVTLKDHQKDLEKDVGNDFSNFIANILNFDALTKAIFERKYENGEIIIFFDAYDNIPSNCKKNAINLFKLFKFNKTNQMFISTRPNFEFELEKKLNILASRIKVFTEEQQIEVLTSIWTVTGRNVNFENCAKELTKKLCEILKSIDSLIGVPIILIKLADFYKERIDCEENFKKNEVDCLNISTIYTKTVLENMLNYTKKDYNPFNLATTSTSPIQIHQFLAVKNLLSVKIANYLGLFHDETNWSINTISHFGIVSYKNNNVEFKHETNAEFLAAFLLFKLLKNSENIGKAQMTFLFNIFERDELKLTRMFFDAMLSEVQNFVSEFKISQSKEEITEILRESHTFLETSDKHILSKCCDEKLFHIFEFFADSLFQFEDHFQNLIAGNNFELPKVLAFVKIPEKKKIEKILENILKSKVSFEELLTKSDLLTTAAQHSTIEIFETIWSKCKEFLNNDQKFKEIAQNSKLLIKSLLNQNNPDVFEYIFEKIDFFNKNMSDSEKDTFFKTENDGYKLLYEAAKIGSEKNLEFLFDNLKKFYSQKLKTVLGLNRNRLLVTAVCHNCEKSAVETVWKKYADKFSENGEMVKIVTEKDEDNLDFNFLQKIASWATSHEGIKVFNAKIKEMFKDKSILRDYLLSKCSQRSNQNALMMAALNFWKNDLTFKFMFEEVYGENFEQLEDFIYETDNFEENVLHKLLGYASPSTLEFAFKKLKNERKKLLDIKNNKGQNYFHVIRHVKPELYKKKVELFVNYVENKDNLQKMLQETDQDNLSPLHRTLETEIFLTFKILLKFYEQSFMNESQIQKILTLQEITFFRDALEKAEKSYMEYSKETIKEVKNELLKYNIHV